MSVELSRHEDLRSLEIIDFKAYEKMPIHIIGCGAIGSRLFEQLICLGATNIMLHDFDSVEHHNLHNQLYMSCHVGMPKVEAALDWANSKYGYEITDNITVSQNRVDKDTPLKGVVMLCVDNFKTRREIMEACKDNEEIFIVIEGRCAPKFFEVRTVNPHNAIEVNSFLESLGDDDDGEAYVSICGLPISFSPVMTGCGVMMSQVLIRSLKNIGVDKRQQHINFIMSPQVIVGCQELTLTN